MYRIFWLTAPIWMAPLIVTSWLRGFPELPDRDKRKPSR